MVTMGVEMTNRRRSGWLAPASIIAGMLVIAILYLRWQGRVWWCACGELYPVSLRVSSMHNSQHLLDAYSLSHILHGTLFYGLFWLVGRRWSFAWRLVGAAAIEVGWEMLENSPIIINRYRAATISLGYTGDSIFNSLGDIGCFVVGFYLARRMGLWRSVVFFVVVELLMLWWMRDNLALNILMLMWPIEAVRKWQGNG